MFTRLFFIAAVALALFSTDGRASQRFFRGGFHAPTVVVRPAPVILRSAPVVVRHAPTVVVRSAPVVFLSAPAYYTAPTLYYQPAPAVVAPAVVASAAASTADGYTDGLPVVEPRTIAYLETLQPVQRLDFLITRFGRFFGQRLFFRHFGRPAVVLPRRR